MIVLDMPFLGEQSVLPPPEVDKIQQQIDGQVDANIASVDTLGAVGSPLVMDRSITFTLEGSEVIHDVEDDTDASLDKVGCDTTDHIWPFVSETNERMRFKRNCTNCNNIMERIALFDCYHEIRMFISTKLECPPAFGHNYQKCPFSDLTAKCCICKTPGSKMKAGRHNISPLERDHSACSCCDECTMSNFVVNKDSYAQIYAVGSMLSDDLDELKKWDIPLVYSERLEEGKKVTEVESTSESSESDDNKQ